MGICSLVMLSKYYSIKSKAQLTDFQQGYPQIKPLVLDKKNEIMRRFGVWQSPFHLLFEGEQQVFSGNAQALQAFINRQYPQQATFTFTVSGNATKSENESTTVKPVITTASTEIVAYQSTTKPEVGHHAPIFNATTLSGDKFSLQSRLLKLAQNTVKREVRANTIKLVFMDSLCPMPQFPNCEEQLLKLTQQMKANPQQQWYGIVNSYYVDKILAKQFAEKFVLTLPLIFDDNNTLFKAYQVFASPYQVTINAQGIIQSRQEAIH